MVELEAADVELAMLGSSDEELHTLLAAIEPDTEGSTSGEDEEEIIEAPVEPVARPETSGCSVSIV